jgi:hypothetical protein
VTSSPGVEVVVNHDIYNARSGEGRGNRPAGGHPAVREKSVGQQEEAMKERGTVDPDKPDPSGGSTL